MSSEVQWSDKVFFRPFVGEHYEGGLASKQRVLVLGESHYCGTDRAPSSELTVDEFKGYVEDDCAVWPGNGFWGKLQRLVTRKSDPTALESIDAWKRVAYANYVQTSVGDKARQRPSTAQWRTGQPALNEMLATLRPNVVLVLGAGTWNHIVEGAAANEPPIANRRSPRKLWLMPYPGGEALSTWVYHPATNYDRIQEAIGIFDELLNRAIRRGSRDEPRVP